MFKFCDPTENTSNRNLKSIFPLTEAYEIIFQQVLHANTKVKKTRGDEAALNINRFYRNFAGFVVDTNLTL